MSYSKFDDVAAKKVGWYVYALRDPRDNVVFYIGKGKSNRWFDHIQEARNTGMGDNPSLKLQRIREIEFAGLKVDAFLIRHGIETEKLAFEIEAAVLHAYRLVKDANSRDNIDLTNIAEVHHPERGLSSVQIAQTLYNAPQAPPIELPCAMFRLPKLWHPAMSDEELRQATLGWWSPREVAKGRKTARYAFAVSRGIIRGVYRIDPSMWRERSEPDRDWEHDVGGTPRWGFPDCEAAPELARYLNTSVKHLYKPGAASAARFLNCS